MSKKSRRTVIKELLEDGRTAIGNKEFVNEVNRIEHEQKEDKKKANRFTEADVQRIIIESEPKKKGTIFGDPVVILND